MSNFDFNVDEIISIQPKVRDSSTRRQSVFNNIQGVVDTSFILNEYKNIKVNSLPAQQTDNSQIRDMIASIAVDAPEPKYLEDVGINILKPEIISLFDFLPLTNENNDTDAKTFINYAYLFRRYKEQQLKNVLDQLANSNTPEANSLRESQRQFFGRFHDTAFGILSLLDVLVSKSNNYNRFRTILASFKDPDTLQQLNQNAHSLMVSLNLTREDFTNLTNSGTFKIIYLNVMRNLLYTSKTWDNGFTNIVLNDDTNNGEIRNATYSNLSTLNNPNISVYHAASERNSVLNLISAGLNLGTTDENKLLERIRLLTTILVNEATISTSIINEILSLNLPINQQNINEFKNGTMRWGTVGQVDDVRNPLFNIKLDNNILRIFENIGKSTSNETIITVEDFIEEQIKLAHIRDNENISQQERTSFEQTSIARLEADAALNSYFIQNLDLETLGSRTQIVQNIFYSRQSHFNLLFDKIARVFNTLFDFSATDAIRSSIQNALLAALTRNDIQNPQLGPAREQQDFQIGIDNERITPEVLQQMTSAELQLNTYASIAIFGSERLLLLALFKNERFVELVARAILLQSNDFKQSTYAINYLNTDAFRASRLVGEFGVPENQDDFDSVNLRIIILQILDTINQVIGFNIPKRLLENFRDAIYAGNLAQLNEESQRAFVGLNAKYKFVVSRKIDKDTEQTLTTKPFAEIVAKLFDLVISSLGALYEIHLGLQVKRATNDYLERAWEDGVRSLLDNIPEAVTTDYSAAGNKTLFSKIDKYTIRTMIFLLIRDFTVLNSPISIMQHKSLKDTANIQLDPHNPQLGRLLLNNFSNRNDVQQVFEPMRQQFSSVIFDRFLTFLTQIRDTFLVDDIHSERKVFISDIELDILKTFFTLLNNFGVNITELFDRGGIDQLTTIATIAKQYNDLMSLMHVDDLHTRSDIVSIDNTVSNVERSLLFSMLRNAGGTGFITNEAIVEQDARELANQKFKLLAVGLPVGFKSTLNKLMFVESNNFSPYIDDISLSQIYLDVFSRDFRKTTDFQLVKTVKFDIDLFTDKNHFFTLESQRGGGGNKALEDIRMINKGTRVLMEQSKPVGQLTPETRNELMNHLLKLYIKLLYGVSLDENHFLINRETLKIDNADSTDTEFIRKFNALVNATINENLQTLSRNQNNLNNRLEFLINLTEDSPLQQYSNRLEQIVQRNIIDNSLTDEEKQVKIALEEQALNIASVFRFAEDISGGNGFYKRLLSPKLFEKILIIDVPCHTNCLLDYYVKVRMNISDNVNA